MNSKYLSIKVERTARYCIHGEVSTKTKYLWIACHGYGQLAENLIKKFEGLNPEEHLVIAPEALSRFYWNGFAGKVSASWMTSASRASEITDYVNYIESLYLKYSEQLSNQELEVILFGFSQGATTISRVLAFSSIPANYSIFWSGNIAHDLNWDSVKEKYQKSSNFLLWGSNDKMIPIEAAEAAFTQLSKKGFPLKKKVFEGGHEIPTKVLMDLVKQIEKRNFAAD